MPVTAVEELTGFPECLDGRVKTLHPRVHAGILADLRLDTHRAQLDELGIEPFDLVVVNLYPFSETVASGASPDECVEQIDIGGPSMVRAAAKNHPSVAVVVDPGRYPDVLAAVAAGGFTLDQRRRLAAEAFAHTATYDTTVASWFAQELVTEPDGWPQFAGFSLTRSAVLRYGENPHQRAALYRAADGSFGLAGAEQLHGKEMSYNNYVDVEAALRAAHDFEQPCVAIVKHTNPCGIAVADDVATAHASANACDPVSAFGGVIAANRTVTTAMAEQVAEIFTEVIAAPEFEPGSLEVLARRKSLRVLVVPDYGHPPVEWRQICGGVLAQQADALSAPVTTPPPGRWRPAPRPTTSCCARSSSPGARCGRSSPTRSCSRPTGRRWVSGWARSTGSTPPGSRSAGPVIARRGRSPRRTRSSRSPTGCRCSSTPGSAPSYSRAVRCATTRSSRRRRPPVSRSISPAPGTSCTDATAATGDR